MALPVWADAWTMGKCRCGARLCIVQVQDGSEVVACSASGWEHTSCDRRRA